MKKIFIALTIILSLTSAHANVINKFSKSGITGKGYQEYVGKKINVELWNKKNTPISVIITTIILKR